MAELRWMWADVSIGTVTGWLSKPTALGRGFAQLNPLRWSAWKGIEEALHELQSLDRRSWERPITYQINDPKALPVDVSNVEAAISEFKLLLAQGDDAARSGFCMGHLMGAWIGLVGGVNQVMYDLAFTREQQELMHRVISCNTRFWALAVNGGDQREAPTWRRHVGLNLALLRYYHSRLAADSCLETLANPPPPPLSRQQATDAIRYLHFASAAYCTYSSLPAKLTKAELTMRAASMANVEKEAIFFAELGDQDQAKDPLCSRFMVVIDKPRQEVILAVRGTASFSDMMADLIGDPVPFAGGYAHAGILDAARRLRVQSREPILAALAKLQVEDSGRYPSQGSKAAKSGASAKPTRRLVLTGHSLGAGVIELLAVLLHGGDDDDKFHHSGSSSNLIGGGVESRWLLPADVQLSTYLFAPPPVYKVAEGDEHEAEAATRQKPERTAAAHAAVAAAAKCAIGFAGNYDIIPRTSLHNGFNLFQLARAVDSRVNWRLPQVIRALRDAESNFGIGPKAEEARASIAEAVETALRESGENPRNPFSRQHAIASGMYHIVGAPGGTAASRPSSTELTDAERPTFHDGCWIYKRSNVLKNWRRRYVWVEDGELRLANKYRQPNMVPKKVVPLTAGATLVSLSGTGSSKSFPQSIVLNEDLFGEERARSESFEPTAEDVDEEEQDDPDDDEADLVDTNDQNICTLPVHRGNRPPTQFTFLVETAAAGGAHAVGRSHMELCATSAAARDGLVSAMVTAVQEARRRCYRIKPAIAPSEFGNEALVADGLVADHGVLRYEAALEAAADLAEGPL